MSERLYPRKKLAENFETPQDNNALVGFHNMKFIIFNFTTNQLCYQQAMSECDKELFSPGDFMIGELIPITTLSKIEQQEIHSMYNDKVIENVLINSKQG